MPRARGLYIDIALGVAKLQKDVDKANRSIRSIKGSTDLISRQLSNMGKAAIGAVAGFLTFKAAQTAIVGFKNSLGTALDEADRLVDVADKVGFTTSALQELRYAAKQNGVETRTLDMALQRFSRRIGEVANGQGELLKTAQQYNVAVKNSDGSLRSNIDILRDFSNVIKNAGSEQEQLRIAFKLFDSEGAALVNLMRQGADGIDDFRRRARELGIVMDEALVRRAGDAKDTLETVGQVIRTQFHASIIELAPDIAKLANELLPEATKALRAFLGAVNLFTSEQRENRRIVKLQEDIARYKKVLEEASDPGIFQRLSDGLNNAFGTPSGTQQTIQRYTELLKDAQTELDNIFNRVQEQSQERLGSQKTASKGLVVPIAYDLDRNGFNDIILPAIREQEAQIQMVRDQAAAKQMANQQEINDFRLQMAEDNNQRLLEINARAVDAEIEQERRKAAAKQAIAQQTSSFLGALANAVESKNFELAKRFRAAQIVIDTASAVMRTYAEYGGTPVGIAAAALVAATGAAQLAAVLQSRPGSSQIRGTGAALPSSSAIAPPQGGTTQTTTTEIHFHGPVYGDKDALARDIIPSLEKAMSDGVRR